jgi:hypothetical protein
MARKFAWARPLPPWPRVWDARQRAAARTSIAPVSGNYEYGGTRFIVVFEPFERDGEPRVSGIYLP